MVAHSSRTDSTEEGRRKLVSIGRAKIPLPLSTQAVQLPQSLQDIRAIVPRSQGRSLLQQQLDGILGRKVVTHDKPGTQNASAAIDASKAMEKHMHGFSVGHRFYGLFHSEPQTFSIVPSKTPPKQEFNPTVHQLQCDVFQVAVDVEDSMLFKIAGPIFGAPCIFISCPHMVTTTVTFNDKVFDMSSKQHPTFILPSNTDARSVGL